MRQVLVEASVLSQDKSTQNAAMIISAGGRSITEVNSLPLGVDSNPDRCSRPKKYLFWEHAERAVIYQAAVVAFDICESTMVCPWAACADCARAIAMSGICRLVRLPDNEWASNPRWAESCKAGDEILRESGVEIVEIDVKMRTAFCRTT